MGLIEEIGAGPVAIDTSAFIYLIEKHKVYHPIIRPVFKAIASGKLEGVTTVLSYEAPARRPPFFGI